MRCMQSKQWYGDDLMNVQSQTSERHAGSLGLFGASYSGVSLHPYLIGTQFSTEQYSSTILNFLRLKIGKACGYGLMAETYGENILFVL